MRNIFTFLIFFIIFQSPAILNAQAIHKKIKAEYITDRIRIDGIFEEGVWATAANATDFIRYEPYNGTPATHQSTVKVLYNHEGIYFGAKLYDSHPDSILTEYGPRDSDNLNADYFTIAISPYNDGLNKVIFSVYANGVQLDAKGTNDDEENNWNAAWYSATTIDKEGWNAEIFIPYSMLRFPNKPYQEWDINFWRSVRRSREISTWNPVNNEISGDITQSGRITGIKNIKPPMRLSLSPYISAYLEDNPSYSETNTQFNYGADIKYGINESFTLDMTLIPDFGQVESDDEIYNLTPFEVKYDENRQFFTEGTELFDKDDVFYSRRIGGEPDLYNSVADSLGNGESLQTNPSATPIINATKISGRTNGGTGIGIFNAMTSATEAIVIDSIGDTRSITTQPFTNYNMVVVDQNFLKNSHFGIFNTNVYQGKGYSSANLTGADWEIKTKSNKYSLVGNIKLSQKYTPGEKTSTGAAYYLEAAKRNGNFRYEIVTWAESDTYNPNAMGYLENNNETGYFVSLSYLTLQPKGIFINTNSYLSTSYNQQFKNHAFQDFSVSMGFNGTLRSYLTLGGDVEYTPMGEHDYYEPHVSGFHYKSPASYELNFWLSPDYRKPFVVDTRFYFIHSPENDNRIYKIYLGPRYRISDHAFIELETSYRKEINNYGYVIDSLFNGEPVVLFGSRNLTTVENVIAGRYIFTATSGITLKLRHYFITGIYNDFYQLHQSGDLSSSLYKGQHNFNFNAFTIDMAYSWYFAPASSLCIVWKNAIFTNGNGNEVGYFNNLEGALSSEAINSLSIKLLYFLDYQKIKKLAKVRITK